MSDKKSNRDLSALKARLGLAKEADKPKEAAAAPVVPPPGAAPAPTAAPQPAAVPPPGGVIPPAGLQPPVAQPAAPQPAPAPAPDPRRDPFAPTAAPAQRTAAAFVDAGPPVEIPPEKKGKGKWIAIIGAVALVPLVVGWSCGRIYGAREIFNRTIDDAKKIKKSLDPILDTNKRIQKALLDARGRRKRGQKMPYDGKLIGELEELLKRANLKATKTKQDQIFRTNYARMEDLVVHKLFAYYNNTLRLYAAMQTFVDRAKKSKTAIEAYLKEATVDRRYGVIFAKDAGNFYWGRLVQVGRPVCKDKKAKKCKPKDFQGLEVRVGSTGKWSMRPGKSKRIGEIVVPIFPDEDWRKVATGKPGYLIYRQYLLDYATIGLILAKLKGDEKDLKRGLSKQAKRQKLFAPI